MGIFDKIFGPNIDVEVMYNQRDIKGLFNALNEGNTKARSLSVEYIGKILEYYGNRTENEFKDYLVGQFDNKDLYNIIMYYKLQLNPNQVMDIIQDKDSLDTRFELIKKSIYIRLLEHLIFDYSIHDVRGKCLRVLLDSTKLKYDFRDIWHQIFVGDFSKMNVLDFPFHIVVGFPREAVIPHDFQTEATFRANCVIYRYLDKKTWAVSKRSLSGLRYSVSEY